MKEAENSSSAFFVTLTYNDETIPWGEDNMLTLWKHDLQCYFKRLRKLNEKLGNKVKLKYYAAGEYGGQTMRPHYHIILFNALEETIFEAWKLDGKELGFVHVGTVTDKSVGYTIGYLSKSRLIPEFEGDTRQPEFSLMSKGLGVSYVNEKTIFWHHVKKERLYLPMKDGVKIAMPRYYRNKIYAPGDLDIVLTYLERMQKERDLLVSYQQWVEESEKQWNIDVRKTRMMNEKHKKRNKI